MIRSTAPRRCLAGPAPAALFGLAAVLGTFLPAQAIRWTDARVRPTLHVRELAGGDWLFVFDGWSTTAGIPLAGGDDQTGAVGVDYGARTIRATESEFIRGGTGGEAVAAPWFPFAPDPTVDAVFAARVGLPVVWSGFRAPLGTVPNNDMGALAFRVPLLNGARLSAAVFLASLGAPFVGAARVDAQGRATGAVFVEQASRVRLADIVAFQFDRGAGSEAVNWAGVEGGALGVGRLSRTSGPLWQPGRSGSALAAGATCDTGFHGDLGARFTVAWFMRQRGSLSGASPIFALGNGWRCFTGGAAGNGLACAGWGGATLGLSDDVQALAANRWLHVALVVDSDNREAIWYLDGLRHRRVALPAMADVPASAASLLLGSSNGLDCAYDLDEFRLSAAAVDAATIAVWANGSPAAAQPFSAACGANLRHEGLPRIGTTFDWRLEADAGSLAALFASATARAPLDLGVIAPGLSGCAWYSDVAQPLVLFPIPTRGVAVLPVPVPNEPTLRGLELFAQALVLQPGGSLAATNAHALALR